MCFSFTRLVRAEISCVSRRSDREVNKTHEQNMEPLKFRGAILFLCSCAFFLSVLSSPINIPLQSVSDSLIQSALYSLNENSPTHHTYKTGHLISAQKLEESHYTVYRLTFNLDPICKESTESCPREACTVDVKQHESGYINVEKDSFLCLYLYPQSSQDNAVQESFQNSNFQEQTFVNDVDKQVIGNGSVALNHEIKTGDDHSDIPFIAVRALNSNYCPGCPYELNPNLPALLSFKNEIERQIDEATPTNFKHIIVDVVKVTRAIPLSSNVVKYQILVNIGESTCIKNTVEEQLDCSLQVNVPIKTCLVTFEEQPWQQNSRRITKNNCTTTYSNISKPSTTSQPSLVNESLTTIKSDEQKIDKERHEVFEELKNILMDNLTYVNLNNLSSDAKEQQELITERPFIKLVLNKSIEQPLNFTNKIKEFTEFLEDFEIQLRSDNNTLHPNQTSSNEQIFLPTKLQMKDGTFIRQKRSHTSSEKKLMHIIAQNAVDMLDDIDADNNKRIILNILDSKKQNVNGFMYYLTIRVMNTHCDEKSKNIQDCKEQSSDPIKICKIKVHLNKKRDLTSIRILNSECYNETDKAVHRLRRSTKQLGAPSYKDINDPEIIQYAQLGLNKLSENFEGSNEPIITEITEASVQVVSGLLYKIKVKLGVSDCPKGVKQNCKLKENSEVKKCLMTIWSQPWIDKGSPNIQVQCDASSRKKRSLKGVNYSQKMLKISKSLKHEKMFKEFIVAFNKSYLSDKEQIKRFHIFEKNLEIVEKLQKGEQGTAEYGITIFSDLTPEEFKANYLGLRPDLKLENAIPFPQAEIPDIKLPTEFDWRNYNTVTPVKDQGQCGSCWAFSVTGNIEGQYAIKHKKLLSLSEQELIDCDKLDSGCDGGLPDNAYRAIEGLGGLELESVYPYEAEDDRCHFNKNEAVVQVTSAVNITSNETEMAQWLVKNGPISIGINANAMQFYVGGVSHPFKFLCDPNNLDHGVLIVGYGIRKYPLFNKELPYWIIKNSWGSRWGEQGYYRVYRGDGTCGVNMMASSAVVA